MMHQIILEGKSYYWDKISHTLGVAAHSVHTVKIFSMRQGGLSKEDVFSAAVNSYKILREYENSILFVEKPFIHTNIYIYEINRSKSL